MSRRLNVASALLFVVGGFLVLGGFAMVFEPLSSDRQFGNEELLGVTLSQIGDFSPELRDNIGLTVQLRGFYLGTLALFWSVISLIPFRKGEKWAWYAMLGIGGIWLSGFLIFNYTGVTLGLYASFWIALNIAMFVLWIVGLALPAREVLGKPSS